MPEPAAESVLIDLIDLIVLIPFERCAGGRRILSPTGRGKISREAEETWHRLPNFFSQKKAIARSFQKIIPSLPHFCKEDFNE